MLEAVHEERLRELGLFSLEMGRLNRILFMCINAWVGRQEEEDRTRLFSMASSDRIRNNGHKLKHRKFCLNIRRHFFTVRVVEHWHKFTREVVACLSLKMLKTRPDAALSNLL